MAKKQTARGQEVDQLIVRSSADTHVTALRRLQNHPDYITKDVLVELIREFAESDVVSIDKRVSLLFELHKDISDLIRNLTQKVPERAPLLWKERKRSDTTNPIDFLRSTYAEYLGFGLTQADIRRLDPDLYRALHNWKQRHGWPGDFHLPTRREANDALLSSYTSGDVSQSRGAVAARSPEARLYEAARYRIRKTKDQT